MLSQHPNPPDVDADRPQVASRRRTGPDVSQPASHASGATRPTRPTRPAILAAIAAGGASGAPARYALSRALPVSSDSFPWATFWTNLSGSFVLGVLLTLIIERWPPIRFVRPFAVIGFLGAYTTWSTFMVEVDQLVAHGHTTTAAAYVVGSLACGLAAVFAGIAAARFRPPRQA